uniref:F-box domain-containing protein n=1 Tax=Mycena chlorophos TaxID=658473 RepID=A0ABQ0LVQ4_MYCCL|nr:predicted protein [Mycena chlorophos]
MHRCLQISEIILNVVAYLPQSRDLAAVALVCRAFEAPALDSLWREPGHDLLQHILGCFPDDLLEVFAALDKITLRLRRPILHKDWERPSRYCARVRSLLLKADEGSKYLDVFSLFTLSFPGDFVFPRLHILRWILGNPAAPAAATKEESDLLGFLRMLIPPTLQRFHIEQRVGGLKLLLSALPSITSRARSLTHVHLGRLRTRAAICTSGEREAISDFVLRLERLESLIVPAIDGRAFLHLAALPGLTNLRLETCLESTRIPAILPRAETFVALQTLRVESLAMSAALNFLLFISSSPLVHLSLTPVSSASIEELEEFYSQLAATELALNLDSLEQPLSQSPIAQRAVSRQALISIGACENLTSLSMYSHPPFDIDGPTLLTVASGLRSLETLRLRQNDPHSQLPLNTLIGLSALCPALALVDLTFDTTTIPSLCAIPGKRRQRRARFSEPFELAMGRSVLQGGQVFKIARFISGLFPELQSLESDWYNTNIRMSQRWEEVQEMVFDLQ